MPELDKVSGELVEKPTLARLTEEGRMIRQLMLSEGLDKETLQEALRQTEGKWLTKVENIGHLILGWENDSVPAEKAEIDRLSNAKRILENRISWLKEYTLGCMVDNNEPELVFPLVSIKIASNPPSVVVLDEQKIPAEFIRIKEIHEVNKTDIMAGYKETGIIPNGVMIETTRKKLVIK